jgi:hypothetical protein
MIGDAFFEIMPSSGGEFRSREPAEKYGVNLIQVES